MQNPGGYQNIHLNGNSKKLGGGHTDKSSMEVWIFSATTHLIHRSQFQVAIWNVSVRKCICTKCTIRRCLHIPGSSFIPVRPHPSSTLSIYICLHDTN